MYARLGGQIVVAPSTHHTGVLYRWVIAPWDVAQSELSLIPEEVLAKPASSSASQPETNGSIQEGNRNDTLFRLACSFRRSGLDGTALEAALGGVNKVSCNPPMTDAEVNNIVQSAMKYPSMPPPAPPLGLQMVAESSRP